MKWRIGLLVLGVALVSGCGPATLMPTPTVYTNAEWDPFAEVPEGLRSNKVSLLYITDRVPERKEKDHWEYGSERSRSAAWGEAAVQIGDEKLSWDELVKASRTEDRDKSLAIRVVKTNEQGRFAPTPFARALTDAHLEGEVPDEAPATTEAAKQFTEELTRRLAQTARKEVYFYVHGFDNSFEDSVLTIAELWHFLGREGVPVAYTWPCGTGGPFSYLYTLNSGQFTNFHLKRALRLIAACPAVENIHIIAHSRGTDGAITAVRDLWLETRGTPGEVAKLKLGHCVWAAADIDMEADEQWNMTERVQGVADAAAVYISHEDKALAFSSWLMGGKMRLGDVDASFFTEEELKALRNSKRVQIIDSRTGHGGFLGHSYFHEDPAVSSDLILFLRYHLAPGKEHGRPLGVEESGFWSIDADYPGKKWRPPATQESK